MYVSRPVALSVPQAGAGSTAKSITASRVREFPQHKNSVASLPVAPPPGTSYLPNSSSWGSFLCGARLSFCTFSQ